MGKIDLHQRPKIHEDNEGPLKVRFECRRIHRKGVCFGQKIRENQKKGTWFSPHIIPKSYLFVGNNAIDNMVINTPTIIIKSRQDFIYKKRRCIFSSSREWNADL